MKCAKCQIREAEPGSLYCSKCRKGYYGSLDPFYKDYYTFDKFYISELKKLHRVRALALLDDILLTYRYYREFRIFDPVLGGEHGYMEEHRKAEEYFYNLFASILEERLGAVGRKVKLEDLKRQFGDFREFIWSLTKYSQSDKRYFGVAKPLLLFIRKVLRSKNIDLNTDFVENLSNFFETGSAIFLL